MLLAFSLLVILGHGVSCLTLVAGYPTELNLHKHELGRFTDADRSKRSLPAAINTLLKSVVRKNSSGPTMEFWKKGSYKDALKDFKKLKPTNVKNDKNVSEGIVGNKMVIVQRMSSGKPTSFIKINDIYERNGILIGSSENVITIVYRN